MKSTKQVIKEYLTGDYVGVKVTNGEVTGCPVEALNQHVYIGTEAEILQKIITYCGWEVYE